MRSARRGYVSGRVQGVGFRYFAQAEAERLGLDGWVRNLPDGRVEFEAAGEERALEAFLAWLRKGPTFAHVSGVEAWACASSEDAGFRVVR
ncbi:MAG: acylphosphatase [Planctomycetes bacterium]|nr:acylphosphatase [Planctomycetota bacterium]